MGPALYICSPLLCASSDKEARVGLHAAQVRAAGLVLVHLVRQLALVYTGIFVEQATQGTSDVSLILPAMWQDAVADAPAKPVVSVAEWATDLDWEALLQDAMTKSAARYDLVRSMLDKAMKIEVDDCISIPK